jgi:hypothetical protein
MLFTGSGPCTATTNGTLASVASGVKLFCGSQDSPLYRLGLIAWVPTKPSSQV